MFWRLAPRAGSLLAPTVLALLLVFLVGTSLSAQQSGSGPRALDTAPPGIPQNNFQFWPSDGLGGIVYGGFRPLNGPPTHLFKGNFNADSFRDILVTTCAG